MIKRTEIFATFITLAVIFSPIAVMGDTAEEIQQQISEQNREIEQLNAEIAQYEAQLASASSKKQTLQNTVDQLNLSLKKLTASISATKKRIATTELEIKQLSQGIALKEHSIANNKKGLAETIRRLSESETESLAIQILSATDVGGVWADIDSSARIREAISEDISELAKQKQSLTQTKTTAESKRADLVKQQKTLVAQQGSLSATKKAQSELLAQTKSQESNFQAILAQKQAAKTVFENALQDLQSKLQYTIDPSKITPAGKGILNWPLDKVRITQKFGNTSFSLAGGYNGKGHNGIDIGAQIGMPVKASLTGTVAGVGDTGLVKGCYSYGRWVLIKHDNGLATLYAHLSEINAYGGQSVGTGQLIGYSGQTGYATGPHLHFGVYVSSATQIMKLGDATNKKTPCSGALMPVAPLSGYLNPMDYL
ncbi:MAG: peptidoglycan DD-metalloendopeptidase family protein [Candidatus Kaiserbacteria bacterium]|nr:peptidoglycan DD-metalloendopeptidase family protein [Candidatus Kaiserbacteria bacterium]